MGNPKAGGPVLIELASPADVAPGEAPALPEPGGRPGPEGAALAGALRRAAAGRGFGVGRLFWGAAGGLLAFALGVTAWDFVTDFLARSPALGAVAAALAAAALIALTLFALREAAAFARLGRLGALRAAAENALAGDDLAAARRVGAGLLRLYRGRDETHWARARFVERAGDPLDAETYLALAEAELLAPLDAAALVEAEAAARLVAGVTALVPLALADLAVALLANLRMIRRIGEIYGGRGGFLGSFRLARAVLAHLVATGALVVGDDLVQTVAGGGLVAKLSRRFGEGVINGALTLRVGVAAIETCRPLAFRAAPRPRVTSLLPRALAGLFARRSSAEAAGPGN